MFLKGFAVYMRDDRPNSLFSTRYFKFAFLLAFIPGIMFGASVQNGDFAGGSLYYLTALSISVIVLIAVVMLIVFGVERVRDSLISASALKNLLLFVVLGFIAFAFTIVDFVASYDYDGEVYGPILFTGITAFYLSRIFLIYAAAIILAKKSREETSCMLPGFLGFLGFIIMLIKIISERKRI